MSEQAVANQPENTSQASIAPQAGVEDYVPPAVSTLTNRQANRGAREQQNPRDAAQALGAGQENQNISSKLTSEQKKRYDQFPSDIDRQYYLAALAKVAHPDTMTREERARWNFVHSTTVADVAEPGNRKQGERQLSDLDKQAIKRFMANPGDLDAAVNADTEMQKLALEKLRNSKEMIKLAKELNVLNESDMSKTLKSLGKEVARIYGPGAAGLLILSLSLGLPLLPILGAGAVAVTAMNQRRAA